MAHSLRHKAIGKVPAFHHEHPSYRWWVLGNVLISTFMAVIESTVVNTALPKMQASFGTSLDIIEWVLTAFNLTFAVVLPLSGWLADKVGYKRIFFLALALFTTGSFLCSLAWNESILIVFRVIQSAGGGMLQPVGMAIVLREFPPKERGTALGFYGIAAAASLSIGPSLGGLLTDNFGWQSIFLINVPFGILAMMATVLIQREYRNPKVGDFDLWGFVTSAIFLISFLLGLADGNAGWNTGGWTSPFIITCFGVSAISLALFLLIEYRVEHPMLNLRLLGEWNFGLSNLLIFLIGMVLMGSSFLFPVYLQGSLGYTAFQAGLIFLPLGLIQGVISPITGIMSSKINPKIPALIGISSVAVSFLFNTLLSYNPPEWVIMLPIVLRGLGFGMLFITIQAVSVSTLPHDKIAQGSSMIALSRQIGAAFGVAVVGTITNTRQIFHQAIIGEGMNAWSPAFRSTVGPLASAIQQNTGSNMAQAMTLAQSSIISQAAGQSFIDSINDAFWLVTVLIALMAIPVAMLKIKKRSQHAPGGGKPEPVAMME